MDYIGEQFGSMVVKKVLPAIRINEKNIRMVEVECTACNSITNKRLDNIRRETTKGCSRDCSASKVNVQTHGMSSSKVYKSWDSMVTRITRPSHNSFKHYDELIQGEKIDPSWLVFENFYRDMGDPEFPKKVKFSIDRINNRLGYSKDNCRWATQQEQLLNQERSICNMFSDKDLCTLIEFSNLVERRALTEKFGKRSFTLKDIGEIFGIGNNTMAKILKGDYFDKQC